MIRSIDIKQEINHIINDNFQTKVLSNKVKDNFKAPAFFTRIETINMDYETKLRNFEHYTVEIHYFPTIVNDDIDILKTQAKLREIFDTTVNIKNRYLEIFNVKERIYQGTLFFNFSLQFEQYKEHEETSDMITEVIINEERND